MKKTGIRHQASGPSSKSRAFFAGAWRLRAGASRGFTVLFATLVAALLLGVGLAIFDIIFKEVSFATVVRDSNYAIYAADTGAECALYWNRKCGTAGVCGGSQGESAFPTSTNSIPLANNSKVMCDGQDISRPVGSGGWTLNLADAKNATTTFTITLNADQSLPYCSVVQVGKNTGLNGSQHTTILSRGYNTCDQNNPNRIERAYIINQ
jgi:hypothetical protein